MNLLYLAHHHLDSHLAYNTVTGSTRIGSGPLPTGHRMHRGVYCDMLGHVYGLYATEIGPVFFADRRRILLRRGQVVAVRQALGRGLWRFVLHVAGEDDLEVRYRPPLGTDPWSNDIHPEDFFAWLEDGLQYDRFLRGYTL